jgi:hypothetical protein
MKFDEQSIIFDLKVGLPNFDTSQPIKSAQPVVPVQNLAA